MHKLLLVSLLIVFGRTMAQDSTRNVIKVQRVSDLRTVHFDEVYYRLIGIDRFGNVLDSAVVGFTMKASINGVAYSMESEGPGLTAQMQQALSRCQRSTLIVFSAIRVRERDGQVRYMPDIRHVFARSDEQND